MRQVNFALEGHDGFPRNNITPSRMSFLIFILCVFGWLGQALNDGANIK